ncbi:MAG: HlyD family secretion protein [Thermodesulfobacteriota bacterium]|nr:HlyD family secretion protein [Thermodesulfobacteriota bacterium]
MGTAGEITRNSKRKFIVFFLFSIIAIIGVISIYLYIDYKKTHITTDDAFVTGRIHIVASKVHGTVKTLYVRDNQFVKEGEFLVKIDDRDYTVKLKQAEAALNAENAKLVELSTKIEVAEKQLLELHFRIKSARANLKLQEAQFKQAKMDLTRARRLFKKEIMPEEQYEKVMTGYDVAAARLEAAKDQLRHAEASLETHKSVINQTKSAFQSHKSLVKEKEAIYKAEDLKKSYTKIYAPSGGYVTKKSIEVGNQIQAGQPLMAVVPLDDVWVTANYKETQLDKVKPGQKVNIKVDTYPGKVFEGTVQSIMAGTGSVFSLFPPENATGNYVKVVQRIPVKIVLDKGSDPNHIFRIGMSVEPTIILKE